MNAFSIIFNNPDFTSKQDPANLHFGVSNYDFAAIGGCDKAEILATGGELGIWDLANYLRCPVTIYDARGIPVWRGYIHEASIEQGALTVSVSLDRLVNRVAVAYSYVATGSQTVGLRKTTAWADNLVSQAEYGVKALLSSTGGMSDAAAENLRDSILDGQAWPQGGVSQSAGAGGQIRRSSGKKKITATLFCRGWWHALGWKYYANTGTTSVVTTAQITAIVTNSGQFMTATDIDAASGISSSEYRDGDSTALAEILNLMAAGGANGRRLISSVDPNRRVQIIEEPAPSTAAYYLDSQARLFGAGNLAVNPLTPPVGVWCRLKDVLPGVVDLTRLADPSLQFIEGSSWSAANGVSYKFKGQADTSSLLAFGG